MKRERIEVARCTVERLMQRLGIQGVRRGKSQRTTRPDRKRPIRTVLTAARETS
jgi:putative transposase